ncbi:MAG: crossover junction endodeoxyribonuclease RuvC [Parcubacteria group bacterium Gr01-1014_33]|nr:MAG: crossover junction endodeoxyribonuclease RuvC [Parcubacteria group bacterium Gr01-1014_33]
MIILGIDPGTQSIGYACIRWQKQNAALLDAGLLRVISRDPGERLCDIHAHLGSLLEKWNPDAAAVEKLFFTKNTKTAMAVSEARGAILLTILLRGIKVFEYTPLEVKKAITGQGRADKTQVKKIVQLTLPDARALRASDDVFDAIAIALTCGFLERFTTPLTK